MELVDDVAAGDAAVGEQFVECRPRGEEVSRERLGDHLPDVLRAGGGGDGVDGGLVDGVAGDGCRLQAVDCLAHVTVGGVDERVDAVVGHLDVLLLGDDADLLGNGRVAQRREPEDGTPGLDGVDDLAGVVTREDEPDVVRELLHRPAQGRLGVAGEGVGLVEEDDAVLVAAERRAGEALDSLAHHVDAALVGSVELEEVLAPVRPVEFSRDGKRRRRLADAGLPGEHQVREVVACDVALESFGDRLLADDVVEGLWAVLLDPDLVPPGPWLCLGLAHGR